VLRHCFWRVAASAFGRVAGRERALGSDDVGVGSWAVSRARTWVAGVRACGVRDWEGEGREGREKAG
jgi:hypothetical protein